MIQKEKKVLRDKIFSGSLAMSMSLGHQTLSIVHPSNKCYTTLVVRFVPWKGI